MYLCRFYFDIVLPVVHFDILTSAQNKVVLKPGAGSWE